MLHKKSFRSKIQLSEYSSIYTFITVLFLIGVIFGAIIVNSMNFIQKQDLFFYLHQFFDQLQDGLIIHEQQLFQHTFFYHVKYVLFIFILGLSIIGIPLIWIFIFLKGIVVGFSVGFLVNQMAWKGLFVAAVSVAPQNLFIIPAYLIAGSFAMIFSLYLIRKLFLNRTYHDPIRTHFAQYSAIFVIVIALVFVASIVESFISPNIMQMVIEWIY
ncbi:stage II sporulation protein M [Salirhabdus salicampi]|uniref:stage II sporulation protein M n=1 Tax=Salirhabdus salicampi TaxID=476102 RepID=UPI0020C56E55|nr:stage II sporulation protein M [Salirhabdus salicampi]MCP8616773.1 stage II sporulation protein M [Salirhabdus salicampi]